MFRSTPATSRRRRLNLEALESRETPAALSGRVFVDFNNDAIQNFGETGLAGVSVSLTGNDFLGNAVNLTAITNASGDYSFAGLPASGASGYTLTELQPADHRDGRDSRGLIGGVAVGSGATNDSFSGLVIGGSQNGVGFNFGERPLSTTPVSQGVAAPTTFWASTQGQNLIKAVNGGPNATQLGNWLAATFPNLYSSLAGQTNTQVAAQFMTAYSQTTPIVPGTPIDTDAQTMATALNCYVTSSQLAGNAAASYGFQVTTYGLGVRTFSVGLDNAAFAVGPNTVHAVLDLLLTVNTKSHNGVLFDNDHNGIIEFPETSYRRQVRTVCANINAFGINPPPPPPGGRASPTPRV